MDNMNNECREYAKCVAEEAKAYYTGKHRCGALGIG